MFLKGSHTKNKRDAVQFLTPGAVRLLQGYVSGKLANVKLFAIPDKAAPMLRADCEAAGIATDNHGEDRLPLPTQHLCLWAGGQRRQCEHRQGSHASSGHQVDDGQIRSRVGRGDQAGTRQFPKSYPDGDSMKNLSQNLSRLMEYTEVHHNSYSILAEKTLFLA